MAVRALTEPGHEGAVYTLSGRKRCRMTTWQSSCATYSVVSFVTSVFLRRTKAIDLWVLFPLGIGVNRLFTKSGDIPESWRRRLNLLLGTEDWYDEFYRFESTPTLFGAEVERVVKASTETIGRYFNNRLKSIFAAVADEPKVLRNSANSRPSG